MPAARPRTRRHASISPSTFDPAAAATVSDGTTWTRAILDGSTWTRRATATVAGVVGLFSLVSGAAPAFAAASAQGPVRTYVVRAVPGHLAALHHDLNGKGRIVQKIGLIQAEVVRLHTSDAVELSADPNVASVTQDRSVTLDSTHGGSQTATERLSDVADTIGASPLYGKGVTGKGVDVALIDSGITQVPGLADTSIVNAADLSFASQGSDSFVDGFGHGTHMAGIIAGNGQGFHGVAPDARLVNVKVADAAGAADVSQVIAGLDWVVTHAHSDGLNIRVVNLSFGTDSTQDYRIDPLAFAAEQAWRAGIVVVVSAGNEGRALGALSDPADDPYVLAVGAADDTGRSVKVAGFSSRGDGTRNPDLVAPGAHIASLRDPGSAIDQEFSSTALTPDGLFKGSGTSEAAAVTSGAVALLLSAHPDLTPDQVKALLTSTADDLGYRARSQGNGLLDLSAAVAASVGDATQTFVTSDGSGSLEASRGSMHLQLGGTVLRGDLDVFGRGWNRHGYEGQSWAGRGWSASSWAGQAWAGQAWAGQAWAGQAWAGQAWAGQAWAGQAWAGQAWAGQAWAGQSWG